MDLFDSLYNFGICTVQEVVKMDRPCKTRLKFRTEVVCNKKKKTTCLGLRVELNTSYVFSSPCPRPAITSGIVPQRLHKLPHPSKLLWLEALIL
ncbi:hypothetical protein QJS04_geneDACA014858 [Acorus gramineus]|uniref:Uncharacterized protein n=1 Tax=Acorus gramineus TaxID=55184 RepID=A0AAV9A309_ACOGR|nr:hypothetical protein QJS04_geneDACA014858 [Acorus gramineus]